MRRIAEIAVIVDASHHPSRAGMVVTDVEIPVATVELIPPPKVDDLQPPVPRRRSKRGQRRAQKRRTPGGEE